MTEAEHERRERFERLFERHLADMVAYCGWRAASRADADDAVAEIFLVAWRRLDDVPDGHEARPWLYATARRVLTNQARTGRRQVALHARLTSLPITMPPQWSDPDDAAAQANDSEDAEAVREALAKLKPVDQEVLLLAEWEGLAPHQIAQVLRCPTVTARGRLHRARRRFRAAFEQLGRSSPACDAAAFDSDSEGTEAGLDCVRVALPR